MTHQGWIASLSDGRTVLETEPVPGEMTSWQKLLDFVRNSNVSITALRLQRGPLLFHTINNKKADGYFQAYEVQKILFSGKERLLQGIGAIIDEQVYITWVDLQEPYIFQDIRPLSSCDIHTTMEVHSNEQLTSKESVEDDRGTTG